MVSAELKAEAKAYVQITWSDPQTDARVDSICAAGEGLLTHYAGGPLSFSSGLPHYLFLEYVRYAWSGAADDFIPKFRAELLGLRLCTLAAPQEEGST